MSWDHDAAIDYASDVADNREADIVLDSIVETGRHLDRIRTHRAHLCLRCDEIAVQGHLCAKHDEIEARRQEWAS